MWPSRALALGLCLCALGLVGCEGCSHSSAPASAEAADAGQAGLSPEQAAQVLARVGTRTITLGDFAAALERMDPFERIRYQTDDRRQALLDEMINVELLAREAERRGLDQQPETQELIRQYQRDELLRQVRARVPGPDQLSKEQVQAYYQAHRAEFVDPERRRAAQIVLQDSGLAARVLAEAASADADRWHALVKRYNPEALGAEGDKTVARPPIEVAGDLGMLSAPGVADPGAASPAGGAAGAGGASGAASGEVPDAVRRAVFEIAQEGQVYPQPVPAGGRFHVLRLISRLPARQRSLEEVEGAVRARLVRSLQEQAEDDLVKRLRQSIPVSIDEQALERVPEPGPRGAPARPQP
ncbi:MAG TPA: peptidylprolyl isomerase [Polyangiaceae bacterium]|nr:peptidylprolyl isomerase [Polyangiaceae bacterium]